MREKEKKRIVGRICILLEFPLTRLAYAFRFSILPDGFKRLILRDIRIARNPSEYEFLRKYCDWWCRYDEDMQNLYLVGIIDEGRDCFK